jgi:predicted RNA-binding Zn-ribbon protein involved in translation (DUF1610 family)
VADENTIEHRMSCWSCGVVVPPEKWVLVPTQEGTGCGPLTEIYGCPDCGTELTGEYDPADSARWIGEYASQGEAKGAGE